MDLVYIYPGGVRTGLHLFFLSVFLKHPNGHLCPNARIYGHAHTDDFPALGKVTTNLVLIVHIIPQYKSDSGTQHNLMRSITALSRRRRRNCHETPSPWQKKAKCLSKKKYCSLSWVPTREMKWVVLFLFFTIRTPKVFSSVHPVYYL